MNIDLQRKIDRLVGVPACWLLSLIEKVRPARNAPQPPQRILVILLSEMGSLVLAQPMFARLKEQYPGASLHVMLFAKNRQILDLLNVVPPENVITISDKSLSSLAGDCLKAIRSFFSTPFDVVIDCELFARVSSILPTFPAPPYGSASTPTPRKGCTAALLSTGRCCTTPIAT